MIFLFEDRQERKEQFIKDEHYPLILEKPIECSNLDELDVFLNENFREAKVFLLHKSYELKNTTITIEKFKTKVESILHIPVVLFSGGSNNNLIQERDFVTAEINSGVMYKNLRLFHDDYQKSGIPNIPLLVYGANYRLNQLMEMQAKVNLYFFNRDYSKNMNGDDVDELLDITDTIKDPEAKDMINKMWNWINSEGVETISINTMQSIIQRMINQL